ncbi:MAG TPA: T9SS type A sorting domain-containing protein [Candidatus Cloacimonadota bacterium]|nr:T9SS type A sorting domain-containing protein [Candidatus Cloacimonadota bacterium]HPS39429.1 T9SS type A sorting domain-containing protein [Candidatus Cloacimonadota bacterium]
MFKIYMILLVALLPAVTLLRAETPWQTTSAAGVTFEYRVTQDSQSLEGKVTAQTTGWVAVGFNPTSAMRNANIIIGYVSGANTMIRDDWGTSNSAHASDISLGGTNNLTIIGGTESAGSTMIHFTIPLVTTDQYDRPLTIGQSYTVILARGANNADNYTGDHNGAGYGSISVTAPVANNDETQIPSHGKILSVYPNPFNPQTTIRYSLAESGNIVLSFFNTRGQLVHSAGMTESAGEHSYVWNADAQPSGAYIVRLTDAKGSSSVRLNLIK